MLVFLVISLLLSAAYSVQDFPGEHVVINDLLAKKEGQTSLVKNILYHLDLVSCSNMAPVPPVNHGTTHLAWPYLNYWTGKYNCYAVSIPGAQSFINQTMIRLRSLTSQGTYQPFMLQQFRIQCPNSMSLRVVSSNSNISLEGRRRVGDVKICVDYVRILSQDNQFCDLCGNERITDNCSFLNNPLRQRSQPLQVTFRSGPSVNMAGFTINIMCFNSVEQNMEGCLETSRSFSWENYKQSQYDKDNLVKLAAVMNYVPHDAVKLLFDFYNAYEDKTLTASMESYKDILALAIIAEKSCDASIKSVGREIQKLFPESVRVRKVKPNTYEEADSYIDSMPDDYVY